MGFYLAGNLLVARALHLHKNVIVELLKITDRFFHWKDVLHLLSDYERVSILTVIFY